MNHAKYSGPSLSGSERFGLVNAYSLNEALSSFHLMHLKIVIKMAIWIVKVQGHVASKSLTHGSICS